MDKKYYMNESVNEIEDTEMIKNGILLLEKIMLSVL